MPPRDHASASISPTLELFIKFSEWLRLVLYIVEAAKALARTAAETAKAGNAAAEAGRIALDQLNKDIANAGVARDAFGGAQRLVSILADKPEFILKSFRHNQAARSDRRLQQDNWMPNRLELVRRRDRKNNCRRHPA